MDKKFMLTDLRQGVIQSPILKSGVQNHQVFIIPSTPENQGLLVQ